MLVRSSGDVLRIMSQLLAMLEGGERVASSDRFVSDNSSTAQPVLRCTVHHAAPFRAHWACVVEGVGDDSVVQLRRGHVGKLQDGSRRSDGALCHPRVFDTEP